jgi:YD repeat-containing protein
MSPEVWSRGGRDPDGTWDLEIQHSLSVYRFDAEGRLVTMTDDFGNTLRWSYDGAGRVMRVADESGSGRSLDVTWGPNGRIADVQDNAGRVVHYDYDVAGMLIRVVDPESRNTHYTYTTGRFAPVLALVRDHWNRTVTFMTWETHDDGRPTGRLRSYMDEGEVYTYAYEAGASVKIDSAGRTWRFPFRSDDLITERQAPGGTESTVYDGAGRVLQSTDPAGVVTQYQWNATGALASVTQAAGTQEAVRFDYSYDANYPWKVTSVVPKDPGTGAVDRDWQESRYAFHPPGSTAPGALWKVFRVKADGTPDTLTEYEYDAKGRVGQVAASRHGLLGCAEKGCDQQADAAVAPKDSAPRLRPRTGEPSSCTLQSLEELDLARVVEVVGGHAGDHGEVRRFRAGRDAVELARVERGEHGAERPVHLVEQREVRLPAAGVGLRGAREPVRALVREAPALLACQAAPRGVLPVGGVDGELVDVVPSRCRAPRRLGGRHAPDRGLQVRAVPRRVVVRPVDHVQQDRDLS